MPKNEKKSQATIIKEHLQKHGSITSLQAFELYHFTRLSAIMYILKEQGFKFKTRWLSCTNWLGNNTNYVEYYIESEEFKNV